MSLITQSLNRSHIDLVEYALEIKAHPPDDDEIVLNDELAVREIVLEEELDRPYVLRATVLVQDTTLDVRKLVGGTAVLRMSRTATERHVHGIILRAQYAGTYSGKQYLRFHIGPALALLDLGKRSRVFQDRSVVEVVEKVVADAFSKFGRRIDHSLLRGTYERRDYCVQWHESDLAFVQRILAEAGITYVFEHTADGEVMVLLDCVEDFRSITGSFFGDEDSAPALVPLIGDRAEQADLEAVRYLDVNRTMGVTSVEVGGWDYKQDPPALLGHTEMADDARPDLFGEYYAFESRRVIEADRSNGMCIDESIAIASVFHEGEQGRLEQGRGWGNTLSFAAGAVFELSGHPQAELDRTYVLVRVVHRADLPDADPLHAGTGGNNYVNEFVCRPYDVPLRPRRWERPRVYGPLLGTVIGSDGQEIDTDPHGRIRVLLHWDREGRERGRDASCWIRVAQSWAGASFGTMFIPRVGMEVVVAFLDGDADRPLVTGCVYNGANKPPYALPGECTKSTIKTASSPGGDGFNELRFEDQAGREEIYVHAQRNLVEHVGSEHRTTVMGDENVTVNGRRTVVVEKDGSFETRGNGQEIVWGDKSETIGIDGGGNYELFVGNKLSIVVGTGTAESRIEITPEEIVLKSKSVRIDAKEDCEVASKSTTINGTSTVVLEGPGSVCKLDGNAELKGGTVTAAGGYVEGAKTDPTSLVLTALDATMSATNATVDGTGLLDLKSKGPATLSSTGTTEVKGAMVLIG